MHQYQLSTLVALKSIKCILGYISNTSTDEHIKTQDALHYIGTVNAAHECPNAIKQTIINIIKQSVINTIISYLQKTIYKLNLRAD